VMSQSRSHVTASFVVNVAQRSTARGI